MVKFVVVFSARVARGRKCGVGGGGVGQINSNEGKEGSARSVPASSTRTNVQSRTFRDRFWCNLAIISCL